MVNSLPIIGTKTLVQSQAKSNKVAIKSMRKMLSETKWNVSSLLGVKIYLGIS